MKGPVPDGGRSAHPVSGSRPGGKRRAALQLLPGRSYSLRTSSFALRIARLRSPRRFRPAGFSKKVSIDIADLNGEPFRRLLRSAERLSDRTIGEDAALEVEPGMPPMTALIEALGLVPTMLPTTGGGVGVARR